MLLRIKDIPVQGKEVNFDLDNQSLNSRISSNNTQPDYVFSGSVPAVMKLNMQGSTVIIEGKVSGSYATVCSRCGGNATKEISTPIKMVLKLAKPGQEQEEDVDFGYYDGEVVNCNEIAEELIVLALPMVVQCDSDECKKGKKSWTFGEDLPSNNPFKNIKLVQ